MLGKGVTAGDWLIAIGIVLPVAILGGALLGLASNHFGISSPVRVGVITAITAVAGRVAHLIIRRRIQARALPDRMRG
jgi:hypothetical protein